MVNKIKVDVDELIEILQQLKDDGFVTAEIEIYDTDFFEGAGELSISAVDLAEEETMAYGTIAGVNYYDDDSY